MPNEAPPPETPTSQPAAADPAPSSPPAGAGGRVDAAADSGAATPPTAKEIADLARHRRGLQGKARELRHGFAQIKDREGKLAEREAAIAKENADLKAKLEKWEKGNPLEHVEDPSKVVRDYVEKTAPERRIDQLEADNKALREQLDKFPKLLEERDRKEAEERQRQQAQHIEAQMVTERQTFTRGLRAKAAEYPYVHAEFSDAEIEQMAAEIQAWARTSKWTDAEGRERIGRQVRFEEAARFLNDRAKRVHEERAERRKVLAPPDGKSGSGTERRDQKTPPGSGPRADRPNPKPPAKRRPQLTPEEEQERDLAMLRDAFAKDAAARAGKSS